MRGRARGEACSEENMSTPIAITYGTDADHQLGPGVGVAILVGAALSVFGRWWLGALEVVYNCDSRKEKNTDEDRRAAGRECGGKRVQRGLREVGEDGRRVWRLPRRHRDQEAEGASPQLCLLTCSCISCTCWQACCNTVRYVQGVHRYQAAFLRFGNPKNSARSLTGFDFSSNPRRWLASQHNFSSLERQHSDSTYSIALRSVFFNASACLCM